MTVAPSPEFERFLASVEGRIANMEQMKTYDLSALCGIREDERAEAIKVLRKRSEDEDDPRVVGALVAINTQEAWDLLMELLQGQPSVTMATAAHTVWNGRRAPEAIDALQQCLATPGEGLRSLSLRILGRVDMPAGDILNQGLRAPERRVRLAAIEAAFYRYKLDSYDNIVGSRVYHLSLGTSSNLPFMYRDAADTLVNLLMKLDGGATLESLGLVIASEETSSAVEALWEAVESPSPSLDPALLTPLTPAEADYAVEYLSRAVERGDDRVLPLLAAIGTPRAALAIASATTDPN